MDNQCNFSGFVATDPKIQENVVSFSIALKKKIKGQDHTSWVNAVCLGKSAEFNQDMQKGDMVVFSCEFQVEEYNNEKRPKFIVNRLKNFSAIKRKFGDGRQQGHQANQGQGYAAPQGGYNQPGNEPPPWEGPNR